MGDVDRRREFLARMKRAIENLEREEAEGDAMETRGRDESHEEGEHGGEAEGMERDRESRVGERRDGWVSDPSSERSSSESRSTKREQDREFEERSSLSDHCAACGEQRGRHAMVLRHMDVKDISAQATSTVEIHVILVCPKSTFTPYR